MQREHGRFSFWFESRLLHKKSKAVEFGDRTALRKYSSLNVLDVKESPGGVAVDCYRQDNRPD